MLIRPRFDSVKIIGYYLGKILIYLGVITALPVIFGLVIGETNPALDFFIGMQITLLVGLILTKLCYVKKEPSWMHGMIVVSLVWLAAMFLGAIPLFLSGHWRTFLDACFEAMSGLATTGLVLVQDLDHLSFTHNLWRHMLMFLGGQGIVIIAISFFVKSFSGALKMYVGEARDEKILPNVINTARFIWLVSIVYLVLGSLSLAFAGVAEGIKFKKALYHGLCIFMAAFDTGGFTPNSQNIMYFHSFLYEAVTIVIMILGAINFNLHYHIWTGNRKEIYRNIETVTLFIAIMATFLITGIGLSRSSLYPDAVMLFRKGFYQLVSGHTGTGFQTIYARQFVVDWSGLAAAGVICAMALGGAVCSTTGAIKMLRIGIIFKTFMQDIKRIILPEKSIVVEKYHHLKSVFLEDKQARAALLITLSYILLYGFGALVGMYYGYPFLSSLFESTSAAANVGLSCGITSVDMPTVLKLTYIIQMWAGRLEFMSIFTLLGFFVAIIKGK